MYCTVLVIICQEGPVQQVRRRRHLSAGGATATLNLFRPSAGCADLALLCLPIIISSIECGAVFRLSSRIMPIVSGVAAFNCAHFCRVLRSGRCHGDDSFVVAKKKNTVLVTRKSLVVHLSKITRKKRKPDSKPAKNIYDW